MGCTDSNAMQNHLHVPDRQNFTHNPHEFPSPANDFSQKTNEFAAISQIKNLHVDTQLVKKSSAYNNYSFQNSQEYLEQLYSLCEGNLQKFFSQLQQKISEIYMSISKDTLEQMNQNVLINNESKIQISEEILWFNLNILKVASRKSAHKFNSSIFKQINKLQKNLVGYLKMKYPRGGQSFVPGDLMAVFKEFDITEDVQFDILKNSDTYFGSQTDENLSKDIKIFLNKIMSELDIQYPRFEKIMQGQVFVVEGDQGQKKTLSYKIGRKIPENVSKYTDLDNNTLEINSPQIFRVIVKWMEYLEEVLVAPNENINRKKNFKCFIEQNEKGENIFDQINEDEYYDLINFQLVEKIEKEKINYHDQNENLLKDMDRFNSHLIKLLDTSIRKQKFVPLREMETIKYSNLNAKFIAWVLGEKLMLALKKLIKIGKSFYKSKAMLNLDLIQFKVTDLMRSMVSGSKKQILAVYENLKKLQKQGTIKIIKIKNRLGTSLNDAMIIFAMKGTSLICQIQLILSDSTQKVNQKYKNIELLNHFFYELQRSPYGILSEIAVLLAYKDSKMAYENNITFELNKIDFSICEKTHPNTVMEIKLQTKPFLCTKCTKFYFKFQNIFLMKHCQTCNMFICGKCIFENDKQLENSIVNRQIASEIERAVTKTVAKLRTISSSTGAASILQMFCSPFKRMEEIFGPKQVQVSKLIDYLNNKVKNVQEDLYFVIVSFRTGKAIFKGLVYKPAWKQIQNPFNQKQVFGDKKKLSYTSYDFILFYDPSVMKTENKEHFNLTQENMLHLFANEEQFNKIYDAKSGLVIAVFKLGDFKLVINMEKLPKEKDVAQISNQRQDSSWKDWKNKCTKTFKYKSLHEATEGLPDLQGAKSILKLSNLGIQNSHLVFFKQINWTITIKQLKLSKNNLSNISQVLEHCLSIERLYVNENYIKQLVFGKQLPKIEIINAANNQIYLIEHVENVQNVAKLLLEGNKLEEFPKCTFPNLKILSLKRNPVKDFSNIYNSSFPNIQQLSLDYEEPDQNSYCRPNNEVSLDRVVLSFQRLKSIQSESNFSSIQILSKKIERVTLYRNELKEIIFTNLENLKYITLSNNNIESLEFLFNAKNNYENNSIQQIDVQKNSISTLPIIKSTSLAKLNIQQNKILQISNLTDSSIPNVQNINLKQNQIKKLPEISFPKLVILNLSQNPIEKISQLQNSKLQSLKKLELSNCGNIESFPLLSLKSLTEIDLSWTQIESMENLSQSQLPNLQKIMLNYCTINNFPVINLDSLEYLDLSSCTIKKLSNLQKSKLNNLKGLILSYVQLQDSEDFSIIQYDKVNQSLQNISFNAKSPLPSRLQEAFTCNFNFPKLQQLRFDGSNFRDMSGLEKSNLPKLQELSIQACRIDTYPKLSMKSLKTLHASTCQIQNMESILSPNLESLQKIYLSGNMIQRLNLNLLQIKVLDLSVNKLVEFTHLHELDELTELNLESNRLQKLPTIKAKNLKQWLFNGNPLTDISQLQFCSLPSLEELRLSSCDLSNSPFPVINLESVKSIYMTGNQIKDISSLFMSNLPILEDINFSQNQLTSIPVLKLPELKFLRLNTNQITDIANLQLSQCPELTIIELQENNITLLPLMPFPNLTKIFIDKNDVIDVSRFNKSTIKKFSILNICNSHNLEEFPMLQCKFQELYASETKLMQVIRIQEYKGLINLHLNGNQITHIPLLNQKELQMIQFQDNLLTDIDEFAQGDYPNCTLLSLKGNQLTTVPLLKMEKLQKIYLNQNLIENIDKFLDGNMPYLQLLTLQDNKLKSLKKLPFPNLTEFYVTKNLELEELNCFNLPEYQQLTMIVADSTGISKVQVLPRMPILQRLWVSNSKLQSLEWFKKSASNLPKLYFANFSKNQVKILPGLRLERLTQFYFTQNPVQNMDQFLSLQKSYLSSVYLCHIGFKGKDEEQYIRIQTKINNQYSNISLSRSS